MKRLFTMFLVLEMLAVLLAGCGGTDNNSNKLKKSMLWEEREFNIYELRDDNPMSGDYEDVDGKIIEIVFQLDGKGNYMFFLNIPFKLYDSEGTEYKARGDMYINSGPEALYSQRFDVPLDTNINDLSLGLNDERFELKNYMDCFVAK